MCGICLLIRQKVANAARTHDGDTSSRAAPSPPTPSTLPVDDQLDTHASALMPTSLDACSLTPCACSMAGLDVRSFLSGADAANRLFSEMLHNLRRRGPDTYGVTRRSFVTSCRAPLERNLAALMDHSRCHGASLRTTPSRLEENTDIMTLRTEVAGVASVLGLRGHSTVAQPYDMNVATDADADQKANSWDYRSSLLWNGEIFGGALCPPPWGSDTVLLATRLSQMELECVRLTEDDRDTDTNRDATDRPPRALLPLVERQRRFLLACTTLFEQQVEGPYSFIFIATRLRLAVFGRDPLGRHSLLSHVRVTRPASGAASSLASNELDVELIVSSVGVQHHNAATCRGKAEQAGDGSAERSRAEVNETKEAATPPAARSSAHMASSTDPSSLSGSSAALCKRPRHEQSSAHTAVVDDDGEEMVGGGTAETGEPLEVCWQEVGVTGLFAVPLQAPLVYCDEATFAPPQRTEESAAQQHTDQLHPVCVAEDSAAAVTTVCGASVLLLHCPWQRTHHLVHPLLRTAALAMVPHEPPPFELILAHEEIAVLPEALLRWASHLMKSMQPDGGLDQSWVDWAAAHYMLALAVSMHRRITVANSGAADGRDAQELSTARRRPLCILFSGGIDCTVIAALAHYILPVETPIELVNVAFGDNPEEAPDRVAAFRSMAELLRLPLLSTSRSTYDAAATPEREWRLVLVDVPAKATADTAHIKDLLVPRHTVMDLDIGTALWYAARASGRMQVLRRSDLDGAAVVDGGDAFDSTPPMPATGSPTTATTHSATSSRLTSGSPTVTLDGFSKHFRAYAGATAVGAGGSRDGATVPSEASFPATMPGADSIKAASLPPAPPPVAQSSEEAANTQKYQLLVDVLVKEGRGGGGPLAPVLLSTLGKEYSLFLQPHIKRYGYKKLGSFLNDAAKVGYITFVAEAPSKAVRLCRPSDMERAAAEPPSPWFVTASMKLRGVRCNEGNGEVQTMLPCPGTFAESYTSHAKVVLLGMGADETLGGYTRYRRFFQREGMAGAQRELERDFARLWRRNLGRDDRVTMDSGREPRFPFLDEGVLRTLEWIVLKRRNHILTAPQHQQQQQQQQQHHNFHHLRTSSSTTTCGGALPNSPTSSTTAGGAASMTSDELLRLALEPIVSFRLQPGEGDKRVLRRVASVLGLSDVTHLQKRAIQFGSRIAERKIKGTTDF